MKSYWFRCVAMAAVALLAGGMETAHARSGLRGLAVAHGGEHHDRDGHHDALEHDESDELVGGEGDDDKWEWKVLDEITGTTTRDVKTTPEEESEIHEEDPDDTSSSDIGNDADDASADEESSSKSFDFDAIAGEASDKRGVSGGYSGAAQNAATPAPSVAAVPIGESAAAAKPISEISASAIQKDPVAYGVETLPPSTTKPVPIGESAAAAKPISAIDPAAIQRDPESYGVVTPSPGTTTGKLADGPMAATKPTDAPADKSPTQKAF